MTRRSSESGFALLLIFVLAAGIAIAMMAQLPRVCFETQRDREQMLIDRGEQYQRAIGLYVRKFNRYPAKVEDLDNTNSIRFLRKHYIDPMTGKDEWRLIHAGPGGVLTDSLVQKAPGVGPDGKPIQQSGMPGSSGMQTSLGMNAATMTAPSGMNANPGVTPTTTATGETAPVEVNQAVKARPSDRMFNRQPGMPPNFDPTQPQAQMGSFDPAAQPAPPSMYSQLPQNGQPVIPPQPGQPGYGQPAYVPPDPNSVLPPQAPNGQAAALPGQPGYAQPPSPYPQAQPFQPQPYPGQPAFPQPNVNQPGSFQNPGFPQQQQPGFPQTQQQGSFNPQQPGAFNPQQQQPGGFNQQPRGFNQQPGGFNQPGQQLTNQNSASQMIQNLLTQPRQPPPGVGGFGGTQQQVLGAGIAGVATKFKGPSIKVYEERQKYQEWEFVYDPRKEAAKKAGLLNKNPQQSDPNSLNPGNRPADSTTTTNPSQTNPPSTFNRTP